MSHVVNNCKKIFARKLKNASNNYMSGTGNFRHFSSLKSMVVWLARYDFLLAFYSDCRSRWNHGWVIGSQQNHNEQQHCKQENDEHRKVFAELLSLFDMANNTRPMTVSQLIISNINMPKGDDWMFSIFFTPLQYVNGTAKCSTT